MKPPNDIPVLREAVGRRRADKPALDAEQLENLRAQLSADMRTLVDELLAEALNDAQENLRLIVNEKLGDELPDLIDQVLRARLGDSETPTG
jgi:hypothetical protein